MVVKTVVEAQDIFDKAWEGFKGEDWKEKASVSQSKFLERVKVDGQWFELWHSQEPEHLKEASLATEKIDA